MGRSIRRCTAGGTKCEIIKGSPGGDDYHYLWINPAHPEHMIAASDQGTVVTRERRARAGAAGTTSPTGQFYHLAADNRFPYRIYSGQQDNGTVAHRQPQRLRLAHRSATGRRSAPTSATTTSPIRIDPNIVYGSGLGGRLSRWDRA